MSDCDFYINELNFYTSALFKAYEEYSQEKSEESKLFIKKYITYCKDYIYFYAQKLTKGE